MPKAAIANSKISFSSAVGATFRRMMPCWTTREAPSNEVAKIIIGFMSQTAITPATTPIATAMAIVAQSGVPPPKFWRNAIPKVIPTVTKTAKRSIAIPTMPSNKPLIQQRMICQICSDTM